MSNKSDDNEVADDLISEGAERVRREALRLLSSFDVDDDDARVEPHPQALPQQSKKRRSQRT